MRIVKTVRTMQAWARRAREQRIPIGFVPTMGCLHAGHLSLVRRARREVGTEGAVVLSIFVNPTQFGAGEDFSRYPRPLAQDIQLCREAGVDVVFLPSTSQMYPSSAGGHFSTYVCEEELSRQMEGASRPTHFRGVTTVVAKLFHLICPDVAVFGQKDYQQAAVVRRMTADLNFGVKIVVAPTVREADGLAMSSRNQYLAPAERTQATVLWQAIRLARGWVRGASRRGLGAAGTQKRLHRFIARQPAARVDYIAFFDPVSLEPVTRVRRGTHLALAVYVGKTRLIDNARL